MWAVSACGSPFSAAAGDGGPGGVGDGGVVSDALSDAPPPESGIAESGAGDWCATHAASQTYCEDFDSYLLVTGFLTKATTFSQVGGTFSFDHTGVPSPPNALEVVTTSTSNVNALVIEAMPKPSTTLTQQHLEFDLRIDSASGIGAASAAAFAAILFGSNVSSGAVALAFTSTTSGPALSAFYVEPSPVDGGLAGFGSANAPPPFPALGTWDGRFAIQITYGASTSTTGSGACAQVYVGSVPQLSPCLPLPSSLAHPTTPAIALGVYSGGLGVTGDVGVRYDNVTYNRE